jgi:FkbM family methyltransferase
MIDVGANIGYFAMVAARAVGPKGRVCAFEPVVEVRGILEKNLRLNDITNVSVRSEALSSEAGTAEFFTVPSRDTGLASLRKLPDATTVVVQRARFDDIWDDAPIALVKIDVEGAELAVLHGMARILERLAPDLVIEITDGYLRGMGSSAEDLISFLAGFGYSIYWIDREELVPISDGRHLRSCPSQFNALCTTRPEVIAKSFRLRQPART